MEVIKLLIIATLFSIIPGQLIRIPFAGGGAITISDILVLTTDLFFILFALLIKKTLKVPERIIFPALLFALSAFASTILAVDQFAPNQLAMAFLFLVRFVLYFAFAIVIFNTVNETDSRKWTNLILFVGSIFILIGFLQFIFLPDLSFLTAYGWDPHQRRIVSTFLDPNFSGWVFVLMLAFSTSLYLYTKANRYLFLSLLSFVAIILTYSRSTYLATIIAVLTIGVIKSPKAFLILAAAFIFTFLLMGQVRTRITGALTVDETARARLESYHNALTIFKDHFAFGVGFNTYRFTQERYGFFTADNPLGGHAGSGSDSSLLLVAATTGIFGLFFYVFLLISMFGVLIRRAKTSFLSLATLAAYLALLVHSQFVNSLFFPQIMLLLFVTLGLNLANDS